MAPPDPAGRRSGADAYPYDPNACSESLKDLDRLRGISDRKLAEYLHELYSLAERNSHATPKELSSATANVEGLRQMADRALIGELGSEARELAEYLLVDDAGRRRADAHSLGRFATGLRKLRAQR